jgi:hypothetical protein
MKPNHRDCRFVRHCLPLLPYLFALACGAPSSAHNVEARYIEPIPWHKEHFSRVFAVGYSMLGLAESAAAA